MGKERDKLVRRYGGVPISEEQPSDAELMRRYLAIYAREGRLPPEISALRRKYGRKQDQVIRPAGRSPC